MWDFLQTDTASVLFEATAQIRHLEGQIEVTFFLYLLTPFSDERALKSCYFFQHSLTDANYNADTYLTVHELSQ